MQVSELFNLINTKIPTAGAAHYNAVLSADSTSPQVQYFSPAGDNYYTIIKNDRTYKTSSMGETMHIEYHTPTHYYTLNNVFTETTIELHNQFRTIMNTVGIVVPVCTAHELVDVEGENWVYNAWQKPFTGCNQVMTIATTLGHDGNSLINNTCVNAITMLNCLASASQGSKVWPTIHNQSKVDSTSFYSNDNGEWFYKAPMAYTNRYEMDVTEYATESTTFIQALKQLTVINPHMHSNINIITNYLTNLDSNVFDVDQILESHNA